MQAPQREIPPSRMQRVLGKTVTYFSCLLFMRQYDNIVLWFSMGNYSLLLMSCKKNWQLRAATANPYMAGWVEIFWQDYEIWAVIMLADWTVVVWSGKPDGRMFSTEMDKMSKGVVKWKRDSKLNSMEERELWVYGAHRVCEWISKSAEAKEREWL